MGLVRWIIEKDVLILKHVVSVRKQHAGERFRLQLRILSLAEGPPVSAVPSAFFVNCCLRLGEDSCCAKLQLRWRRSFKA